METFDFNGKVVIEFYANGCLNCQMITPIIDRLEYTLPDIRFYRIDADLHTDLVKKFQITSLPCLLLFRNGQKLSNIIGSKPEHTLRTLILDIFK